MTKRQPPGDGSAATRFKRGQSGNPKGRGTLLKAEEKALMALDASSRASVRSAVIVLRDEDKAAARAHFRTPLVFSVHEAKGLEYPNVILFNLVSGNRAVYSDLCRDVVAADLEGDELDYRRAKDKADKSLELNKFYVNALYVAMTRAMEGLAVVEADVRHPLLGLLMYGWRFVNPSKDGGFADDPKNPMGRATRAVAAMRERLLRPYSSARRKAYCKTAVSTGSTTGPIAARRP